MRGWVGNKQPWHLSRNGAPGSGHMSPHKWSASAPLLADPLQAQPEEGSLKEVCKEPAALKWIMGPPPPPPGQLHWNFFELKVGTFSSAKFQGIWLPPPPHSPLWWSGGGGDGCNWQLWNLAELKVITFGSVMFRGSWSLLPPPPPQPIRRRTGQWQSAALKLGWAESGSLQPGPCFRAGDCCNLPLPIRCSETQPNWKWVPSAQ